MQRISIIAATAILILALLFTSYGFFERKAILKYGRDAAAQIAERTALTGVAAFDAAQQLLAAMNLLVNPPVRGTTADPELVDLALRRLKSQTLHILDLAIISATGKITVWTGSGAPPSIIDRDYYSYHANNLNSTLFIGKPLLSRVKPERRFIAISKALRDEQGNLTQVLCIIMDVSLLRDYLGQRFAIPGSTQLLLDDKGEIYTRTPDFEQYVGKTILHPEQLEALSTTTPTAGFYVESALDNKERIVEFQKLTGYPLIAVGTISVKHLLAGWTQRLQVVTLLWVVLSLCIILVARRALAISRKQIQQANTDGLTGIHNRRSIMRCASDMESSQQDTGLLALLMIDIDNFKRINDRFGHPTGDTVICAVAEMLRNSIRSTDIVGRYGGEEFLVLMPDISREGAQIVAEKLRLSVAGELLDPIPITISIGVAMMNRIDQSLEQTLARADSALYQAKADGRNCIRHADDSTSPTNDEQSTRTT